MVFLHDNTSRTLEFDTLDKAKAFIREEVSSKIFSNFYNEYYVTKEKDLIVDYANTSENSDEKVCLYKFFVNFTE